MNVPGLTKQKKQQSGFTLVEMMVVVVILGTLSAVAIPAFQKFIYKSKTSEAPLNVKAIANGAVSWYGSPHADKGGTPLAAHFPFQGSPNSVPGRLDTSTLPKASLCANGSPQYKVNSAQWDNQPWKSLKFGINKAHYFRYTYQSANTGTRANFAIAAESDLTCRGKARTFIQCGNVNAASGEVERSNMLLLYASYSGSAPCLGGGRAAPSDARIKALRPGPPSLSKNLKGPSSLQGFAF